MMVKQQNNAKNFHSKCSQDLSEFTLKIQKEWSQDSSLTCDTLIGEDMPQNATKRNLQNIQYGDSSIKPASQQGDGSKSKLAHINDLYKGLTINLITQIVFNTSYYFWYRFFKNFAHLFHNTLGLFEFWWITLLAASIAGIISNPFFQVSTYKIVHKERRSTWDYFRQIYKERGLAGFTKGATFSILLALNPMINFIIYEKMRSWQVDSDYDDPGFVFIFLISVISKFVAWVATYPLLTLRTIAYTGQWEDSAIQLIINFTKHEGLRGMFRGLDTKLSRTTFSNSFSMVVFEKSKFMLKYLLQY